MAACFRLARTFAFSHASGRRASCQRNNAVVGLLPLPRFGCAAQLLGYVRQHVGDARIGGSILDRKRLPLPRRLKDGWQLTPSARRPLPLP